MYDKVKSMLDAMIMDYKECESFHLKYFKYPLKSGFRIRKSFISNSYVYIEVSDNIDIWSIEEGQTVHLLYTIKKDSVYNMAFMLGWILGKL